MIAKLNRRRLSWYFENVWLPDNRDKLHGSMVAAIKKTIADFKAFTECDVRLDEIEAATLAEFLSFSVANGFSVIAADTRCQRIRDILQHAGLSDDGKPAVKPLPEPGDSTLRYYVRNQFQKLKQELRPHYLQNCNSVIDIFCRWYGGDIDIADVTPEMIIVYEESGGGRVNAMRIRSIMRTYDPVKFKVRSRREGKKRNHGDGSDFLLANVYSKQYEPIALRARRPNTKRLYWNALHFFDLSLGRPATLDDLNDDTISKFAAHRAQNVTGRTVNKNLFCLLAIWRWCNRKGMIETWPDVKMSAEVQRTPVAWSEAELQRLYKTLTELRGLIGLVPRRDWWTALFLVAWHSGERINAIIELKWDRVDLSTGWINFAAEDRKAGVRDNAVQVGEDAIAALKKIKSDDWPEVFPFPFGRTYLWKLFGDIVRKSGLQNGRNYKFHCIRKSVASHYEAAGGNATELLRHSRRKVTEHYIDPKIARRQQPIDLLPRLVGKQTVQQQPAAVSPLVVMAKSNGRKRDHDLAATVARQVG